MAEVSKVYAIMEVLDGEPLILNYHLDLDCDRLANEASDPDAAKLRAIARFPDRLSEILSGKFEAPASEKVLIELVPGEDEGVFEDGNGNLHRIAPCKRCVFNA